MDESEKFLEESSHTPDFRHVKTSTAAKENVNWRDNSFQKRLQLGQTLDSLYISSGETQNSVLSEVTNKYNFSVSKPEFNLQNGSSSDEDANSSLGLLPRENFSDVTETSLTLCSSARKKQKSKKKHIKGSSILPKYLQQNRINKESCASDSVFSSDSLDVRESKIKDDVADSSDIEFDGTNIPELNYDYNPFSITEALDAIRADTHLEDEQTLVTDKRNVVQNETKVEFQQNSELSNIKFDDNQKSKSDSRESVFENFVPAYESILKQLMPSKNLNKEDNSLETSQQLVKVSSFLAPNSFKADSVSQNFSSGSQNLECSTEKMRYEQNLSVEFSEKQISARSSSFGVSSNIFGSEAFSVSSKDLLSISSDFLQEKYLDIFKNELSRDEILSGSCFVKNTDNLSASLCNILQKHKENDHLVQSLESDFPSPENHGSTDLPPETCVSPDLAFYSDLLMNELQDCVAKEEEAKEMLKKDEEIFHKEHMFEPADESKVGNFSSWSVTSMQSRISPPSWFAELDYSHKRNADRHISIGTLISARSEKLGCLSEDSNRERPSFGIPVATPQHSVDHESLAFSETSDASLPEMSDYQSKPSALKTVPNHVYKQDNAQEMIRASDVSELLRDISASSPLRMATKIFEKCMPYTKIPRVDEYKNSLQRNEQSLSDVSDNIPKLNESCAAAGLDNTLTKSSSQSSNEKDLNADDDNCKVSTPETSQCLSLDQMLNISNVESTKGDNKVPQTTGCQNCLTSSQRNHNECFTRPASACSSASNNPTVIQNALSQYACIKCQNSCQEHSQQSINPVAFQPPSHCLHSCQQQQNTCMHQDIMASQVVSFPTSFPIQQFLKKSFPSCESIPMFMSGTAFSPPSIKGPAELNFPEKLCVGDSQQMSLPVENSHSLHCFYYVSCTSANINDFHVPVDMAGLSFPTVVPKSHGNITVIQVTLSPRYEGKIQVELQISLIVSPVEQTLNSASGMSFKTRLQYEAVRPSVCILSKGKEALNFGSVFASSTIIEYVSISNKSEVTVPLQISLSEDIEDNRINFGLNEINRLKSSTAVDCQILSPKLLQYRLPAARRESVPFDIPIVFEAGNRNRNINFTVTAALQTPTVRDVLAYITISASVGISRLILKDRSQNPLRLTANEGTTVRKSLEVLNEGSLCAVYDLHIEEENHSFNVFPTTVNLQPMQSSLITITFTPSSSQFVKGNLQAAAQPHGKVLNITEIIGDTIQHAQNHSSVVPQRVESSRILQSRISNSIECNKKFLAWGGVDIGNNGIQKFIIRNATNCVSKTKIFLKEKSSNFQLMDNLNQKVFTLKPMEEETISLKFTPTEVVSYSGTLVVKSLLDNQKQMAFVIPLGGYGGTGKIEAIGLTVKEGIGHCLDINIPEGNRIYHANLVISNTGHRDSFVKVLVSSDKQVVVYPKEFVLLKNEKKTLIITVNCLKGCNECGISGDGIITILYGDEIMRQQIRRIGSQNLRISANDPLHNINFDIYYEGEEKAIYDTSYPGSPKDDSLFYASMKKLLIPLQISEQSNASQLHFDALSVVEDISNLSFNSNTSSRYLNSATLAHSPPVKESAREIVRRIPEENACANSPELSPVVSDHESARGTNRKISNENYITIPQELSSARSVRESAGGAIRKIPKQNHLNSQELSSVVSVPNIMKEGIVNDFWTVKPEEIVVETINKDNRILLISHSSNDLRFKVQWNVDVISVSPVSGVLSAYGQLGLRISIISHSLTKLSKDYEGHIKIFCGSCEKTVPVKVIKEQRKQSSAKISQLDSEDEILKSAFLNDETVALEETQPINAKSVVVENIYNFPTHIHLEATLPKIPSETLLILKNPGKSSVKWNIRSISIVFSHVLEDSFENTDPVIQLTPLCGVLDSMKTKTVVIKFLPPAVGDFSQHFEISLNFENGIKKSSAFKIEGGAKAVFSELKVAASHGEKRSSLPLKERPKTAVSIDKEVCEFPSTAAGKSSSITFTLRNRSTQDIKLSVIEPRMPFVIRHSGLTVKSKKFITVPVHFKPIGPGFYEDTLLLHSEEGPEFEVHLKGRCS
ncbi:centrosomal protein of 192 kDa-like isoform X2 [Stegodyphus dumicola]|uniref:centrosomal protein of 192 kDa-like isoform X2 n=1 Tax=Stegodyphus dumicola TaxID=202533 RepID=UPI0015AB1B80|nr:centrosomal protein of 192 kDa-like isoform X2 [Stegodyphus dumicola]